MEPFTSALILTKLRPPVARQRTVRRERLLSRLSLEPGTDLVLVCAPAGYGKTTLLVAWTGLLRQADTAVAWYALDEGDNSPVVFGSYLVSGLELALGPGSGLEPVRQVLRASVEPDLLQVLPAVINAVYSAGKVVVLVLDDYHLIRSAVIHQAVEFLISHRPENLHLVIGSRANPPLALARLRAQGRLIELRASDLRFNADETGQFLRGCMQLDLPADIPERLAEQVEGWAAGLQLAALSLGSVPAPADLPAALTGQHRHLSEYLLEEVINQLPEDLQSFLLYTSLLERISAPLCDALLSTHRSAEWINRLEQANLFLVALDEQGIWFRYHHLFRDFLRAWLGRTQPERAAALHRAACGWFAGHGLLREAADHAFCCQDWAFAADFVEQHSFTLIIQSEIATIYEWCSAFPEAVMRRRPKLCVFQALALAYRFQAKNHERIETRLRQVEQALATLANPEQAIEISEMAGVVRTFQAMTPTPHPDVQHLQELAWARLSAYPPDDPGRFPWLLAAGYVSLAMGRPVEAADAFQQALPLALDLGLHFGYVEASFHLARLAHNQGRLNDTLEICSQAKATLSAVLEPEGIQLAALGCLDVAAGCVLLEQGRLDEAGQHLRLGLERMGWGMNPYYLMTAYLAQFRLNELRGRVTEATASLDQLDALWPDIHFLTRGYRAQALLRRSPDDAALLQQAAEWMQSYTPVFGGVFAPRGTGPIGSAEAFDQADRIWLRMQIALGRPPAEWPEIEVRLQYTRERGLTGPLIEWLLVQAQRLDRAGEEEQALAVLESALAMGCPAGYLTVFCQDPALDDLIHRAARRGIAPGWIDRLLGMIRALRSGEASAAVSPAPPAQVVDALTERELEILRIIATGASNQDIAARLVLTVGTVKGHINHILGKLGVSNRTEAVAKARQRGFLE